MDGASGRCAFLKIWLEKKRGNSIHFRFMSENTATETAKRSRTPLDLGFMDVEGLQRFITDIGKILPRSVTGLTPKQQRHVTRQIKRARQLLLLK